VEIVWSHRARSRLEEIRAYVAKDKPDAAARLATRIVAVVEALRSHPSLGRVGAEPGIRELVIGGTPYIILYSVKRTQITISTIWHGAQSRKKTGRRGRTAK
jgi:toxin ParE1/3/4